MANRKQTPDVLGAVLGDPAPIAESPAPKRTTSQPKKAHTRKSPQRKIDTKASTPRQWEYLVVTFYDYGGWKPRFRDGRELSDWKGLPDMPDYINLLGESGWELAGTSNGRRREIVAFFKRTKRTS